MLNFQTLKGLLEAKFQGSRKDGIEAIARAMALTFATEEDAKAAIEKMTAEDVNATIGEYRKTADAEITKAIKTNEDGLRAKYNFVDKNTPAPTPTPTPAPNPTPTPAPTGGDDIKTMIAEALKAATAPLQAQLEAMKAKDLQSVRLEALNKELSAEDIPNAMKATIRDGFTGRQFATDEDFNAYLEAQKQTLANYRTEMAEKGLSLASGNPGKGGASDNIDSAIQDYIKAKTEGNANNLQGKQI